MFIKDCRNRLIPPDPRLHKLRLLWSKTPKFVHRGLVDVHLRYSREGLLTS